MEYDIQQGDLVLAEYQIDKAMTLLRHQLTGVSPQADTTGAAQLLARACEELDRLVTAAKRDDSR